jgi:hypothetical protein
VFLLCASFPAYGTFLNVTFSGVFGGSLGPVHAGDAFSGSGTWDTNALVGNFAVLSSFTLTLPAGDGLSVPPSALFAGAHWNGSAFDNFQINDMSTVDHAIYVFFLSFTSVANGAAMSDAGFTQNIHTSSYQVTGPTVIPEPATGALSISASAVLAFILRRLRRSTLRHQSSVL